jgi:CheY-like chemotaxis protein
MKKLPASLRVLIVENHEDTRNCLRGFFESLGHTVLCSESMHGGIQLLGQDACDVLLSDIGLPDGDGWKLLEATNSSSVYAIAMSGFGSLADRRRSLEAGYRSHLVKPFMPDELLPLLAKALEERTVQCEGDGCP